MCGKRRLSATLADVCFGGKTAALFPRCVLDCSSGRFRDEKRRRNGARVGKSVCGKTAAIEVGCFEKALSSTGSRTMAFCRTGITGELHVCMIAGAMYLEGIYLDNHK